MKSKKNATSSTCRAQASEEGVHASQEQERDRKSNNNATSSTSRAQASEEEKHEDEHDAGSRAQEQTVNGNNVREHAAVSAIRQGVQSSYNAALFVFAALSIIRNNTGKNT
jgi:hypothetical protein